MSAKVMGLALESDLPRPEKFILLALADHSKEDGSDVYPSVARIEWKTGYSERQVRSIIDKLEKRGILQVVHNGGSGPADVRKYKIVLWKIPSLPDFQSWKGAKTAPMLRVQSETEKGAISDKKGCNLKQGKGAEIAPESITRTNTEPNHQPQTPKTGGRAPSAENKNQITNDMAARALCEELGLNGVLILQMAYGSVQSYRRHNPGKDAEEAFNDLVSLWREYDAAPLRAKCGIQSWLSQGLYHHPEKWRKAATASSTPTKAPAKKPDIPSALPIIEEMRRKRAQAQSENREAE